MHAMLLLLVEGAALGTAALAGCCPALRGVGGLRSCCAL